MRKFLVLILLLLGCSEEAPIGETFKYAGVIDVKNPQGQGVEYKVYSYYNGKLDSITRITERGYQIYDGWAKCLSIGKINEKIICVTLDPIIIKDRFEEQRYSKGIVFVINEALYIGCLRIERLEREQRLKEDKENKFIQDLINKEKIDGVHLSQ